MHKNAVSYALSFFTWFFALVTFGILCKACTAKSDVEYGDCAELTMEGERYFMIFFILLIALMALCVRDYSKNNR